jgi:hypothetical protein
LQEDVAREAHARPWSARTRRDGRRGSSGRQPTGRLGSSVTCRLEIRRWIGENRSTHSPTRCRARAPSLLGPGLQLIASDCKLQVREVSPIRRPSARASQVAARSRQAPMAARLRQSGPGPSSRRWVIDNTKNARRAVVPSNRQLLVHGLVLNVQASLPKRPPAGSRKLSTHELRGAVRRAARYGCTSAERRKLGGLIAYAIGVPGSTREGERLRSELRTAPRRD